MPLASFKSFIGIAKDTTTTTLSANVAAAAVTVNVVGTSVAAGSTIFIWDGPLSESRAVTAGGGTSTLTVAALTNAHSAGVTVTAQTTGSTGPTDYIPVTELSLSSRIDQLHDEAIRGSNGMTYGSQQGVRNDMLSLGGPLFPDTIGYILGSIFGSVDFAAGTPNTHTFGLQNTGNGQPTPFTIYDFDGVNTRALSGAKCEECTFKIAPSGLITYSSKWQARQAGVVANPTQSYSSLAPVPAWQIVTTVGGSALGTLLSADVSLKRPVAVVPTLQGIQDPYSFFSGPLKTTGKLVFVMEDDTQYQNFLTAASNGPSVDITATSGTGAAQVSFGLHFTKCNYESPVKPLQTGQPYVQLEVPFEGIMSTTDATVAGGGYSPGRAVLKNSKASGTFQ